MPQILFLTAVLAAGVFVLQQRLSVASRSSAGAARQIAYQMWGYHQASVSFKSQNPTASGIVAAPPPALTGQFRFSSCADARSVATYLGGNPASPAWFAGSGASADLAVLEALIPQILSPPGLGMPAGAAALAGYPGQGAAQAVPVPGVGLSTGAQIQTGQGLVDMPKGCAAPVGVPVIETQVLP